MPSQNPALVRSVPFTAALFLAASGFFLAAGVKAQENASANPMAVKGAYSGMSNSQAHAVNYVELAPENATGSSIGDPAHEGIKLHGHWTIDVKDPDGTLVKHTAFENSLLYDGGQYLTALLSGYAVAGDYVVYFTNANAAPTGNPSTNVVCPAPASTGPTTYPYCAIAQNINTQPGIFACLHYYCVGGLTATPTFGSGSGAPNFTLAGSITAPQAGAIVNVDVSFNGCNVVSSGPLVAPTGPGTITATQCDASTTGYYTGTMSGTTLPGAGITVIAGQIIQITVTYTFS